jgi:hypothetical protein
MGSVDEVEVVEPSASERIRTITATMTTISSGTFDHPGKKREPIAAATD